MCTRPFFVRYREKQKDSKASKIDCINDVGLEYLASILGFLELIRY